MRAALGRENFVRLRKFRGANGEVFVSLPLRISHRFNMELDLQSLIGLHVRSCTHWLRPRNPPPAFGLTNEGAIGQPRINATSLCEPQSP
jgi:hypothetical protein